MFLYNEIVQIAKGKGVYMSLKALRANVNLSQDVVAERLGISRQSYRSKENGKSQLTLKEAWILSDLFNTSLEVICIAVGLV